MIQAGDIFEIGKFQKTHGLKGELNMISELSQDYFEDDKPIIVNYDGIWVPFYVETIRKKGSTSFLIKLEGINSEDEASKFVNLPVYILRKDVPEWMEEELSEDYPLVGFRVLDGKNNSYIGVINDIDDTTQNTLFVISTPKETEIYLPAHEELIKEIDDEDKTIIMDIPEGLLDINERE